MCAVQGDGHGSNHSLRAKPADSRCRVVGLGELRRGEHFSMVGNNEEEHVFAVTAWCPCPMETQQCLILHVPLRLRSCLNRTTPAGTRVSRPGPLQRAPADHRYK